MNKQCNWRYKALAKAVAAATLLAGASTAQALSFEFGDGGEWELDVDTLMSYSAQWRVAKPDDHKIDFRPGDDRDTQVIKANSDDGSRNFNRSLVQNKVSVVTDLNLAWRNFGLFARGRANYDAVYDSKTDQDERGFLTYNSAKNYGGDAGFRRFPDGTVDEHRDRVEMLDYFLFAGGELPGDRLFDIRLGSQVINWGEATFYQGINGLQNPVDAIAANNPGVEVKEILLPTGAIYAQVDVIPDVTFEAYYQYEWKKTELNGVGSFFSTTDWLGPGAASYLIPLSPDPETGEPALILAAEKSEGEASDSGQWGAALHWVTDGGTDFGLYYVNAHSKAPSFYPPSAETGLSYRIDYFEDIQGYAASFTTVWGITNVQGEISYQKDAPVVDADGNPDEGDVITAQLGGSYVLEPTALWDDGNLTFELATAYVDSHDSDDLRFDDSATAFALRAEFSYINVYPGVDIKVPIFMQRTFDGIIREANMIEDGTTINLTVKAIYLNNFSAQVGYTTYFDGGHDNLLTDRDNVSFAVSYSF
jgi:hypothetical protein